MGKKKHQRRKNVIPLLTFTAETFELIKRALDLFEQPLQAANLHDDKVVLAGETLAAIRNKLDGMKRLPAIALPFNYNEMVVIRHALLMYGFQLLEKPYSPAQIQEIRQCHDVARHFTGLQV